MKQPVGRTFALDDEFIASFSQLNPGFGYGGLGELVYRRTYSRLLDGEGSQREEWYQTVRRVVEGVFSMQRYHFSDNNLKWDEATARAQAEDMYRRIFEFKFLPPGRGLWACGTALTAERGNFASLNNCTFVSSWNDYRDSYEDPFCFCFDMSQCGVGVGFDTDGAGRIPVLSPSGSVPHTIGDSREGWVLSIRLLLRAFFYGEPLPVFDYSEVRPAGSLIKGFGGVSQGAEPLRKLHGQIEDALRPLVLREGVDEWDSGRGTMTITAIVDIFNLVGACVISGNIRRSAEIAFGPIDSEEFINLKNYELNPQRAMHGWVSNNSVIASVGDSYTKAAESLRINGEPGIIWLENMRDYGRMCDQPDYVDHRVKGSNPCVVGSTMVLTSDGLRPAVSLVGTPFTAIVDGRSYRSTPAGFWSTGVKPVYRLTLASGFSLDATANHRILTTKGWKQLGDLTQQDSVVLSENRGATFSSAGVGDSYEYDEGLVSARSAKKVFQEGSKAFNKGLLREVFDDDGAVIGDHVQLSHPDIARLGAVQRILATLGIMSQLRLDGSEAFHQLRVSDDSAVLFSDEIGFGNPGNRADLEQLLAGLERAPAKPEFRSPVKSVELVGMEEVYDCTVPGVSCFSANGIIAHNCVEVSLESYELCCLVEVMPTHADDMADFAKTLQSALLYAKTVSLGLTDWQITNSIIARNHRIGCSLTGLAQFVAKHGMDELKVWCQDGYSCLREADRLLSEAWGVRESIKLTAIKPSGTVSILSGSTPGLHLPICRFYIRRVRISTTSDLLPPLVEAGLVVEPCAIDPENTAVVSFPVDAGEGVRTLEDTNVYEQLEMAAFMQHWWADLQVSATITFKESEGHLLERALELYQHRLKGISFLPECTTAYPQMPYEKITEQEYLAMAAGMRPVKYGSKKPEPNDGMDTDIPDKFCSNDLCLL